MPRGIRRDLCVRLRRRSNGRIETRIEERMKALSMSETDLGAVVGMAQPTINKLKNGRIEPRTETALAVARALGTTVEDLWPTVPPSACDSARDFARRCMDLPSIDKRETG